MKTSELDYYLPSELIAQQPAKERSASRLLVLDRGKDELLDRQFSQIGEFLRPGDCLVVNNTRVIPARFFAKKSTGAKIEGLFLGEPRQGQWQVLLKNARRLKPGEVIELAGGGGEHFRAKVVDAGEEGQWTLEILTDAAMGAPEILEKIGIMPLPPYIKRQNATHEQIEFDRYRYQTVYANQSGAVAAPTAGLHFTPELMSELKDKGVEFASVTLHVGMGTFKPVTVEDLKDHKIHSEYYQIDQDNAAVINRAKEQGRRVIAIGTTSVRTLESAAKDGRIDAGSGNTELFILPGFEFKIIDGMVTNFHLPKSTLLALVGAFAGMEKILAAYGHAVRQRYRFFSYGDAMLIL